MVKLLVSLIVLSLLAFIGYHQFGAQPLTARATLDAGLEQVKAKGRNLSTDEEQLLRLQLALSDYQATHGAAPESLNELVPKYFDAVPNDPFTSKPYEYHKDGRSFRLGSAPAPSQVASNNTSPGKKAGTAKAKDLLSEDKDFVNPNELEIDDFVYDPNGTRDPFEPMDRSEPTLSGATPLERYTLGQLRMAAVLTGFGGEKKAIVEDTLGKGYTVGVGTKIGPNGGVIVEILDDTIKIVETKLDFTGKEIQNAVELKIVKETVDDVMKKKKKAR